MSVVTAFHLCIDACVLLFGWRLTTNIQTAVSLRNLVHVYGSKQFLVILLIACTDLLFVCKRFVTNYFIARVLETLQADQLKHRPPIFPQLQICSIVFAHSCIFGADAKTGKVLACFMTAAFFEANNVFCSF